MLRKATVLKVFENKFGQVVKISFDFVLCLFGFVEATKFRDSREYSDCVQNIWALPPLLPPQGFGQEGKNPRKYPRSPRV